MVNYILLGAIALLVVAGAYFVTQTPSEIPSWVNTTNLGIESGSNKIELLNWSQENFCGWNNRSACIYLTFKALNNFSFSTDSAEAFRTDPIVGVIWNYTYWNETPISDYVSVEKDSVYQLRIEVSHFNRSRDLKWSFFPQSGGIDPVILPDYTYTVTDIIFNGTPAKSINLNLPQDYNISLLMTSQGMTKDMLLRNSLIKQFGDVDVDLYISNVFPQVVQTDQYPCNCTKPKQNNTEECVLCVTTEIRNMTVYQKVDLNNLSGLYISHNSSIIEVPHPNKIVRQTDGRWGYSVYTAPFILGKTIPEATWWNTSWAYRLGFNLTGVNDTKNNYVMKIVVNTTHTTGTNYSYLNTADNRWADDSGNLLNFWLAKNDSASFQSYYYVTVNLTSGSTTQLFLYYGNSTATNASSITNTFGSNLVSMWGFENTPLDLVGSQGGTLNGAPTLVLDRGNNTNSSYKLLNSSFQSINASNSSVFDVNPFSIVFWVKTNDSNWFGSPVSKWWDGSKRQFEVDFNSYTSGSSSTVAPGWCAFYIGYATTFKVTNGFFSGMSDNRWHQWVVTNNGTGNISIYAEGVRLNTTNTAYTMLYNKQNFTIGQSAYSGARTAPLNGSVYGVRFYNKLLTTTDVAALYITVEPTVNSGAEEYVSAPASDECTTPTHPTWWVNKDCTITSQTITDTAANLIINGSYTYKLVGSNLYIHGWAGASGARLAMDSSSTVRFTP